MSRKKVTVVGGGFVGSTTAQRIVDLELADVVLTDILEGAPAGKALDMVESTPITRTDSFATGISTANGDYSATAGSDVVGNFDGFVIANDAQNFSVGANLFQALLAIQEEEWDEIDLAVRAFQNMPQECALVCAGRPWGRHGAAATVFDGGGNSTA